MTIRGFKIDAGTGDLVFTGGRLEMVSDREAIAQALRSELRLIKGEWPFDTSKGVDYFGKVLVRSPNRGDIQNELRAAILRVLGVATLESLDFTYNAAARTLSATFEATDDTGELIADTVEV